MTYRDSMREAFTEYCKAAIEEGFTANEAWQYISKRLVDVVPRATLYRWAEKELLVELSLLKVVVDKPFESVAVFERGGLCIGKLFLCII